MKAGWYSALPFVRQGTACALPPLPAAQSLAILLQTLYSPGEKKELCSSQLETTVIKEAAASVLSKYMPLSRMSFWILYEALKSLTKSELSCS